MEFGHATLFSAPEVECPTKKDAEKERRTTMRKTNLAAAALAATMPLALSAYQAAPVTRAYGAEPAATDKTPVVREARRAEAEPAHGFFPLGLYLLPNIGFPGEHWDVGPVRINLIAGRNRDVYGLDLGLVGNMATEEFSGLQSAGLFNRIGHSDGAVQLAGVFNHCCGDFTGLQAAIANVADGEMDGLQIGLYNRASVLDGMQLGFFNIVDSGDGVQIGVINSARELDGLQIGVINIIRDSSMPFLPLLNFAF